MYPTSSISAGVGGGGLWGRFFLLPRGSVGSAPAPFPKVIWKFSAFNLWPSQWFYSRGRGYVWEPNFCQWGWWPNNLWFETGGGGAIRHALSSSWTEFLLVSDALKLQWLRLQVYLRHHLDSFKCRWNVKIKGDLTVSQDSKRIHRLLSDLPSVWLTSRKRISMGTDKCLLFTPWNNQVSSRSLTNLALYLGGCKQPLSFHVQPNYLPEFLFKSRERKKKKKSFLPPSPFCMELITVFSSGRVGKNTHWAEIAHKTGLACWICLLSISCW